MPTQKITMGRDKDTDYQMKLKAAQQGSDSKNNYMWGLQTPNPKYGNSNLPSNEAVDIEGNFSQDIDTPGNMIPNDVGNHTGFLAGNVSSTVSPQEDPREMGQDAAKRVAMIQAGHQFQGHNNRQNIYGA